MQNAGMTKLWSLKNAEYEKDRLKERTKKFDRIIKMYSCPAQYKRAKEAIKTLKSELIEHGEASDLFGLETG